MEHGDKTMQGFTVVAHVGATLDKDFRNPIEADSIKTWWEPTRQRAEEKLSEVQQEVDGVVQIES